MSNAILPITRPLPLSASICISTGPVLPPIFGAAARDVGLSTPLDLTTHPDGHGYGDRLLAGAGADVFRRDLTTMRDASPASHINRDLPPTLLLVGERDFPMLASDALAFVAESKKAGASAEFAVIPGKDHMGMAQGMTDDEDAVLSRVSAFLERRFARSGEAK